MCYIKSFYITVFSINIKYYAQYTCTTNAAMIYHNKVCYRVQSQ